MGDSVRVTSGEQPRYFSWGASAALSTTTNQTSNAILKESPYSSFEGIVKGTGAVTATLKVYGTNDPLTAATPSTDVLLGTITLSGTTRSADGFTTIAPWRWVYAVATNVTGTGAAASVIMGV